MVSPVRKRLTTPISAEDVLALRAGDVVGISGHVLTARDRIHKILSGGDFSKSALPFDLAGAVLYHCGPVIDSTDGIHRAVSAGPTTSMRVEMYTRSIIERFGVRAIMGKGGLGPDTLRALRENACVYLHTFGGAAVYLAERIRRTDGVWMLEEFGPAEAMWSFHVQDFPAVVTMDAFGNDLHREIEEISSRKYSELIR